MRKIECTWICDSCLKEQKHFSDKTPPNNWNGPLSLYYKENKAIEVSDNTETENAPLIPLRKDVVFCNECCELLFSINSDAQESSEQRISFWSKLFKGA